MSRFTIVRDTREKAGLGYIWDESSEVFGTQVKKLDTGDYSIEGLENKFCIERKKSVTEIAQNIIQPRFWRELERMREFTYVFLVCEFSYEQVENYPSGSGMTKWQKARIRIKPQFILSSLRRIETEFDVPVLMCETYGNAKTTAFNIMRKIWQKENYLQ